MYPQALNSLKCPIILADIFDKSSNKKARSAGLSFKNHTALEHSTKGDCKNLPNRYQGYSNLLLHASSLPFGYPSHH
ncbi:hypothetical protein QWZ13_04690 [Reinekea marina]|uniref:hypothetical protein n=1 Tax=Reinekea marina TaxID=1310421 RepID=UPI0025B4F876|nr:hypothetical protein [Reinekea marina]MDN3648203.1 hypothetical protein [Reinekea marina]